MQYFTTFVIYMQLFFVTKCNIFNGNPTQIFPRPYPPFRHLRHMCTLCEHNYEQPVNKLGVCGVRAVSSTGILGG